MTEPGEYTEAAGIVSRATFTRGRRTLTVTCWASGECAIAEATGSGPPAPGFYLTAEERETLREALAAPGLTAAEAPVRFRAGDRGDADRVKASIAQGRQRAELTRG